MKKLLQTTFVLFTLFFHPQICLADPFSEIDAALKNALAEQPFALNSIYKYSKVKGNFSPETITKMIQVLGRGSSEYTEKLASFFAERKIYGEQSVPEALYTAISPETGSELIHWSQALKDQKLPRNLALKMDELFGKAILYMDNYVEGFDEMASTYAMMFFSSMPNWDSEYQFAIESALYRAAQEASTGMITRKPLYAALMIDELNKPNMWSFWKWMTDKSEEHLATLLKFGTEPQKKLIFKGLAMDRKWQPILRDAVTTVIEDAEGELADAAAKALVYQKGWNTHTQHFMLVYYRSHNATGIKSKIIDEVGGTSIDYKWALDCRIGLGSK